MTHVGTSAPARLHPVTARDVAVRPFQAYRMLVAEGGRGTWRDVAGRLALSALLFGTVLAVLSTRRVTLELVLSVSLYWSFVPVLQLAAGMLLVLSSPHRAVPAARAVDVFFAGHLPWSLWLLAIAGAAMLVQVPIDATILTVFAASALLPLVWTVAIITAFGRTVLRLDTAAAITRALGHQALLWTSAALFFIWLTDSWRRVMGMLTW